MSRDAGPGYGPFVGDWAVDEYQGQGPHLNMITLSVSPTGSAAVQWAKPLSHAEADVAPAPPSATVAASKVDVVHGDAAGSRLVIATLTPDGTPCSVDLTLTSVSGGAAVLEGSLRRETESSPTAIRFARAGAPASVASSAREDFESEDGAAASMATVDADAAAALASIRWAAASEPACADEPRGRMGSFDPTLLARVWASFEGLWVDRTRAIAIAPNSVEWKGSTAMPATSISVTNPIVNTATRSLTCLVAFPAGNATWTFTVGERTVDGVPATLMAHARNAHGFEATFTLCRAGKDPSIPRYARPATMMMLMLVPT